MKKLSLLVGLLSLTQAYYLASKPIQDKKFPNLYYNDQSAFANNSLVRLHGGLFDTYGNSFLPNTSFENVLVAWDLNAVVFDKQFNVMKNIQTTRKKYGTKQTASVLLKFGKLFAKKEFYKYKNDPRGYVWDGMFTTLETDTEGKKTAALLRTFAQEANVLSDDVAIIIEELSALPNAKNAVLSNMGQGILDFQIKLLQENLRTHCWPGDYMFFYDLQKKIIQFLQDSKHNVVASKENGWMHKPDYICYQTFLKKHPKKSLTIFIDDKPRNIKAALKTGLFDIAIRYTNAKELRTILYHLGRKTDGNTTRLLKDRNISAARISSFKRWAKDPNAIPIPTILFFS